MPKTLAMLKMEKNFIAHIEKQKPRYPYARFSAHFILTRINQEFRELRNACATNDADKAKEEIADISNFLDYLFEKITTTGETQ